MVQYCLLLCSNCSRKPESGGLARNNRKSRQERVTYQAAPLIKPHRQDHRASAQALSDKQQHAVACQKARPLRTRQWRLYSSIPQLAYSIKLWHVCMPEPLRSFCNQGHTLLASGQLNDYSHKQAHSSSCLLSASSSSSVSYCRIRGDSAFATGKSCFLNFFHLPMDDV